MLVYVDFGLLPGVDLALPRSFAGAAATIALVYGLIRETRPYVYAIGLAAFTLIIVGIIDKTEAGSRQLAAGSKNFCRPPAAGCRLRYDFGTWRT